jgi:hypothetical protein
MITLSQKVLDFLVAFVSSVYVKEFAAFKDSALESLKTLFLDGSFTLEAKKEGKGNKTVAHNARERFYLRVSMPNVNTPLVLKPRFAKTGSSFSGLYGYHVSLDTDVVSTTADIENFLKAFDPDKLAKGAKIADVINSAATRQLNEDIGNNFAQACERVAGRQAEMDQKAAEFTSLPESAWLQIRKGVSLIDSDLATFIDKKRLSLASK